MKKIRFVIVPLCLIAAFPARTQVSFKDYPLLLNAGFCTAWLTRLLINLTPDRAIHEQIEAARRDALFRGIEAATLGLAIDWVSAGFQLTQLPAFAGVCATIGTTLFLELVPLLYD